MKSYLDEYKKWETSAEEPDERKKPKIPEYVGECIYKIAENLSRKGNFVHYTFREEMVGDAIENCTRYLRNFDPEKGSKPFAYFTQICYYAFLRRIKIEDKQKLVKYACIKEADRRGDFTQWAKSNNLDLNDGGGSDAYANYLKLTSSDIERYETALNNKKRKKNSS